jgi:hypothetical protein
MRPGLPVREQKRNGQIHEEAQNQERLRAPKQLAKLSTLAKVPMPKK